MIEKSTDGEGEVGLVSRLSMSIGSGWNGKSEVVRKGDPSTLVNSREKRGDSSGSGVVGGRGRDRFGGGVVGLMGGV